MQRDKLLLTHNNRTFIEHVHNVATQLTNNILLLGHHPNLPPALRNLPQHPDAPPNKGPISALNALLQNAHTDWTLLLACDLPLLTAETINILISATNPNNLITVFSSPSSLSPSVPSSLPSIPRSLDPSLPLLHPATALYHKSLLPKVQSAIATNELSLTRLIRNNPHTAIPTTPHIDRSLTNINTPEDLQHL